MARDFRPIGFARNIDRRAFLLRSAQTAGAALLVPRALRSALAADAPVVDTSSGKIRGVAVDGINAFKGVPYGAPTGGRDRFMPPKNPEPWAGGRRAGGWGGPAPESPPRRSNRRLTASGGRNWQGSAVPAIPCRRARTA